MVRLHLDVTNQSFSVPRVRLSVAIDDVEEVDDVFTVDDQHTIVRHELDLRPGHHTVTVTASDQGSTLHADFELPNDRWATVAFWGPDDAEGRPITWTITDERLVSA